MGLEAMRVLGLNPNQALQHPGFYYYMAARCTERRRERFLTALESEVGPRCCCREFLELTRCVDRAKVTRRTRQVS